MDTEQIGNIRRRLCEIKERLEELSKTDGSIKECYDLWGEEHRLKRNLSLLNGEETAVLINWKYPWDCGTPIPYVVSNGYTVFLIYYLAKQDQDWSGSYTNLASSGSDRTDWIALVEFNRAIDYKFGGPNDEVLHGHPLFDHGLEAYEAHEIVNSSWIAIEEKINSVHQRYEPEFWKLLKHYAFTFHDEMFECIARNYKIEVFNGAFKDVVREATERLLNS